MQGNWQAHSPRSVAGLALRGLRLILEGIAAAAQAIAAAGPAPRNG